MAYRSIVNEFTRQAPARLLFRREMQLLCVLVFEYKPRKDLAGRHSLEGSAHIHIVRICVKNCYDIWVVEGEYMGGDLVGLCNP